MFVSGVSLGGDGCPDEDMSSDGGDYVVCYEFSWVDFCGAFADGAVRGVDNFDLPEFFVFGVKTMDYCPKRGVFECGVCVCGCLPDLEGIVPEPFFEENRAEGSEEFALSWVFVVEIFLLTRVNFKFVASAESNVARFPPFGWVVVFIVGRFWCFGGWVGCLVHFFIFAGGFAWIFVLTVLSYFGPS